MTDSRDDAKALEAAQLIVKMFLGPRPMSSQQADWDAIVDDVAQLIAAVLSAPGRETTPTKKWGEVETVAPQYSVSPTPTPTEPEPSEEAPLTVAEAVRLRYGARGLTPEQVREIVAALRKLARAHAEVCPSKDECATLKEALSVVSRFTEEGSQGLAPAPPTGATWIPRGGR